MTAKVYHVQSLSMSLSMLVSDRQKTLSKRCQCGANPFIRTNKTGSTISASRFVLYRIHKGIWWGRASKQGFLANKLTKVILYALQPAFPFSKKFFDTFWKPCIAWAVLFAYGSWRTMKSLIANQTVQWTVCRGGAQSAKSLYLPHKWITRTWV